MPFKKLSHFEGSRAAARPMQRVADIKAAAHTFRRDFAATGTVTFYKSFELVRVPYPTKFGYTNAYKGLSPFMHLCNRLFVIQFQTASGLKTLLASPSDWETQRDTPFFAALDKAGGKLSKYAEPLIAKKVQTVPQALASIGLRPEDVDYLTYDHLHTQNLRRWLGTHDTPALFPNAKLLIMREEWEATHGVIPWQNQWFCPDGLRDIPANKLELLDHDVLLGAGLALVRTKGHTEGNHSIVANTEGGIFVTSENGVGLDSYAPERSKVPGVAEFARQTGAEVVLNGNTLEYAVDQYLSMIQEKTIAGDSLRFPGWPNLAPSSESAGHWLFPQTAPTVLVGDLHFGQFTAPTKAR